MSKEKEKLIIIGAGEFAEIAYEYFTYDSHYEIVAFSVEKDYIKNKNLLGLPVVPFETELYPWLSGYYMTELTTENIWMVRIINVKLTLDDLPVTTDGEITVKIIDDHCLQNNQTYAITSKNGKLNVEELGEQPCKLKIAQEGLASLIYGLLTADDLDSFDWIKNATKAEKELLNAWFPILPPILTEGF